MKKTVDNRVSGWYNNQRRQGRHTSFGGLAQLGARLVSKHTPSQIVLRQSNSQQKTPSKRFASWILWGISSAGRALAWHARGHRFDPGILHQKSTVLRLKYGAFLFAEAAAAVDFVIPKKTPSLLIGISCRDVLISTRRCLNNEGHLITATISFMMFGSR